MSKVPIGGISSPAASDVVFATVEIQTRPVNAAV